MNRRKNYFTHALIAVAVLSLASVEISAGDKSFSTVVKQLQSNYKAKRQGTFGGITFGRFLVKLIRPAGVKNFKVVILKELDFSHNADGTRPDFHSLVRNTVSKEWQPLVQFTSQRDKKFSYVYTHHDPKDVKVLAVVFQKNEAFVFQFKFSPEKLIKFMEDPKLMGISLKGNSNRDQSHGPDDDPASEKEDAENEDEDSEDEEEKQPPSKEANPSKDQKPVKEEKPRKEEKPPQL